ncbi:DUF4270 domain-containing protein [Bizionia gelidisalsuginis]|uniref:DUF4270 domain-containing protein n=1 Tax=Bizionia gelidisalsuginis TaxID=291188 RepID=A0ABY3MB52_9FLAO|nr:DUF4270 domain-containing protein [Bizionia gelidisalsuginis]TYC13497.1 DUF4270 domain-containing protein [Bizionia gelidisalsuginis]
MKKTKSSLKSIAFLGLILVISVSCDRDFTNIESGLEGIQNFDGLSKKFPLITYTKTATPFSTTPDDLIGVQTNGLSSGFLGVYSDPNLAEFGKTTASMVAQIVPNQFNPDFGTNPVIESVVLNIPYFSTVLETGADGNSTYQLNSVVGDTNVTFKVAVYKNNYLLRDLDPSTDFDEPQAYYSNQEDLFYSQEGALLFEDGAYAPSAEETRITEIDEETNETEVVGRFAPSFRAELHNATGANSTFWNDAILAIEGQPEFSNANNFTNHFRGLVIKVDPESTAVNGSLAQLNFDQATLIVDYTNDEEIAEESEDTTNLTQLVFNLKGNRVNLLKTEDNTINLNGDPTVGGDNLYLKGGDGAMVVVDLFNGLTENEEGDLTPGFEYFKSKKGKWLINEVNLTFYVNQDDSDGVAGDEPDRVTLYNLKTNTPIIDYSLDGSISTTSPINSKTNFSQILKRDSNGRGIKYRFRITDYVNNILLKDSTNVKLGLYIASNINNIKTSKIQGSVIDEDDETVLTEIPSTSILSPKGTVLHGSKSTIPEGQRAEFEIYYTQPNN